MQSKAKSALKAIFGSYVCLAFAALLLCDVTARLTYDSWRPDRFGSPNRSWVWWAAHDYHKSAAKPDVLLLGSSLMMAALHGGDATYLNTAQNVAFHHRAAYLEKLLSNKMAKPVNTFAFAIGGQMASDAYVLARVLCTGEQKPASIVYGIAPRDFFDNTLPSPSSTETWRLMGRVGDLRDLALEARPFFWDQVEYVAGQFGYLYGQRPDFVYLQQRWVKDLLKSACGFKELEYIRAPFALRRIAMLELPEDNGPNELFVMPYTAKDQQYIDNISEYQMRYKAFKEKSFKQQLKYLERLLAWGREQGVGIVLVNMPLTEDNVALLKGGMYDLYLNNVSGLATKYSAKLIDLNTSKLFPKKYFADSVHLNGAGGKRFFEVLSERLVDGQEIAGVADKKQVAAGDGAGTR